MWSADDIPDQKTGLYWCGVPIEHCSIPLLEKAVNRALLWKRKEGDALDNWARRVTEYLRQMKG